MEELNAKFQPIFEHVVLPVSNFLARPEILVPLMSILLALTLKYYRTVTKPRNALGILAVILAIFGGSMFNGDFRANITRPDNLPIVMLLFTVFFFMWLSLRRAAINDERAERGEASLEAAHRRETVLVWPDLVMIELICIVALTAFLVYWAVVVRAPLEEPASAARTPNPSKAPWYFLGLQEMLVYFDPWYAGVVLPGIIVVGLMAIPYLDTNPRGNGYYTLKERGFAITVFLFGFIIFWIVLIVIGTFLRGANWNFFGPYEYWDPHKQVPLMNINISEIFWVKMLKTGMPKEWYIREIPGILMVLGYLVITPLILIKTVLKPLKKGLDPVRFSVVIVLMLFMLSLPIKMIGRWLINLKYIVYIPEYFINL